eukprot:1051914-Pelagomonas_calceolata.AAC.3
MLAKTQMRGAPVYQARAGRPAPIARPRASRKATADVRAEISYVMHQPSKLVAQLSPAHPAPSSPSISAPYFCRSSRMACSVVWLATCGGKVCWECWVTAGSFVTKTGMGMRFCWRRCEQGHVRTVLQHLNNLLDPAIGPQNVRDVIGSKRDDPLSSWWSLLEPGVLDNWQQMSRLSDEGCAMTKQKLLHC